MSTEAAAAVSTPAGSLVKIAKEGDSLFGKIFKVLKEDAEHVIAEIKTEIGVIEKVFEKKHVNAVVGTGTTAVTQNQVKASTVALETAPAPAPSSEPAIPAPTPQIDKTEPEGQPAP